MEGGPMSDRDRCRVRSRGTVRGWLIALGVLWSPAIRKHRKISPWLLLPGHRRNGAARRRGRRSPQHASPGAAERPAFDGLAAISACS
jgi:hypothetical protein